MASVSRAFTAAMWSATTPVSSVGHVVRLVCLAQSFGRLGPDSALPSWEGQEPSWRLYLPLGEVSYWGHAPVARHR